MSLEHTVAESFAIKTRANAHVIAGHRTRAPYFPLEGGLGRELRNVGFRNLSKGINYASFELYLHSEAVQVRAI